MILSLIGPPCAGKGTQARILQDEHSFKAIGAGDLLREAAKNDPECKQMIDSGVLVPVEYIWNLMEQAIEKELEQNPHADILLDGYPRELNQAVYLDKYLTSKKQKLYLVNMHVETEVLVNRMLNRTFCEICGNTAVYIEGEEKICCDVPMGKRKDDTIDTFIERLNIYNKNINIVKHFYDDKDTCVWLDMDASASIEEMNQEFHNIINLYTKTN